ncbi:putative bHLH domain-containing protein [Smittium culicis]|uniref:Putative bHLH domain-containing protein n=1 Tax=Smittium culicis TaxID=133412 RepID=A0A1R1YKE0_9FUNG|nr:putative bHLH domain-containing protein [Smittium culicis]
MFPNAALSSHRISMSGSHKQSYPTSLHSLLNDDSQQDAYIFKLEKKNSPNSSSTSPKIPQKKNDYNKSYNFRPIKMISLTNEYQNNPTQTQPQPIHQSNHISYRNHFNHEFSHDRNTKSENNYNIGHNPSSNNKSSSTPNSNSNSSSNHSINPSNNNNGNNHVFHHNHSYNPDYSHDPRSISVPDNRQNHHHTTTLKAITTSSSLSPPSKKRLHSVSSYEDDYSHESGENNSSYHNHSHNSITINSNNTPHRNTIINHNMTSNNINHPHFDKLPKVPLSSISNSSNKSLNVAISPSINNLTPQLSTSNMQMNSILTSTSSTSLNRFPVGSHEWQRIRRENHKQVERRRREHINAGVNLLSTLVPGCEKNKGKVLHQAAQYISQLKADELARTKQFESEISDYKSQISKLQDQIKQLHKNLNQ